MSRNDNPHDEGISRLYHLGSSGEPPEHLDQKILDEAQRAVDRKQWVRAWPSLATAAVLVLSFTLLLRVLEQRPLDSPIMLDEQIEQNAGTVTPQEEAESRDAVVTEGFKTATPPPAPAATTSIRKKSVAKPKKRPPPVATEQKRKRMNPNKRFAPDTQHKPQVNNPVSRLGGAVVGGAINDEVQEEGDKVTPFVVAVPAEKKSRREMEAVSAVEGCGVELPAAGLPATTWQQLYKTLLEQEKIEQARCLSAAFELRFGYKLELEQKPASLEE